MMVFIAFELISFVGDTAKLVYGIDQSNLSERALFGWLAVLLVCVVVHLANEFGGDSGKSFPRRDLVAHNKYVS